MYWLTQWSLCHCFWIVFYQIKYIFFNYSFCFTNSMSYWLWVFFFNNLHFSELYLFNCLLLNESIEAPPHQFFFKVLFIIKSLLSLETNNLAFKIFPNKEVFLMKSYHLNADYCSHLCCCYNILNVLVSNLHQELDNVAFKE